MGDLGEVSCYGMQQNKSKNDKKWPRKMPSGRHDKAPTCCLCQGR